MQTETRQPVLASSDARDLYREQQSRKGQPPSLLCLKDRFLSDQLKRHFSSSQWSVDLLKRLQLLDDGVWLFAEDHQSEHSLTGADMDAVIRAAGIAAASQGNVRCTWSIRTYGSSDPSSGGVEWLKRLERLNRSRGGIAHALTRSLRQLSEHIFAAGGRVYVEQISLLLSKDAGAMTKSLTPVVHADEYYGIRETAVLSVFEDGWSAGGGTRFFPTISPASLGQTGRLDWPDFRARFGEIEPIVFQSGDLVIYDGMADAAGDLNLKQGVPHISGDIAGQSSRLLVLMRHELPV